MAGEIGTREVLEQVDARLDNVDQDIRGLRPEIGGLRGEMNSRFDRMERRYTWLYGLLVAVVIGVAGLWLK